MRRKFVCVKVAFLVCIILSVINIFICHAETISDKLQIGDYVQFGRYNDEPIIWEIISRDENGYLVESNKFMGKKAFDINGSDYWQESTLRKWLNSDTIDSEIYSGEDGFLSYKNFNENERFFMRESTHMVDLPYDKAELSENGIDSSFIYGHYRGMGYEDMTQCWYNMGMTYYHRAEKRVNDLFFIPQFKQKFIDTNNNRNEPEGKYWTSSPAFPISDCKNVMAAEATPSEINGSPSPVTEEYGIRPATYINPERIVVEYGNGTVANPFVIGANYKEESDVKRVIPTDIMTFVNGELCCGYNVDGKIMVDIENIGLSTYYDDKEKSLYAFSCLSNSESFKRNMNLQFDYFDGIVLPSNIRTVLNGVEINSCVINNRLFVPVDDLGVLDENAPDNEFLGYSKYLCRTSYDNNKRSVYFEFLESDDSMLQYLCMKYRIDAKIDGNVIYLDINGQLHNGWVHGIEFYDLTKSDESEYINAFNNNVRPLYVDINGTQTNVGSCYMTGKVPIIKFISEDVITDVIGDTLSDKTNNF